MTSKLQGNGIERCKQHFGEEGETFIVDVYNGSAYPWDTQAKQVGGICVVGPVGSCMFGCKLPGQVQQ